MGGVWVLPSLWARFRVTCCGMIGICRHHARNVKRWCAGQMTLRWCAHDRLQLIQPLPCCCAATLRLALPHTYILS